MPLIKVSNLSCQYAGKTVLHELNLSLDEHRLTVVIGPNGAGKSTLLRLIAGMDTPSSGFVALDGHPVHRMPKRKLAKKRAWVSQAHPGDIPLSVYETVCLGRYPHQSRFGLAGYDDPDAVQTAMKQTDILHLADQPMVTLSGGEAKRVWIAQALCQQPELMFLDEPTAPLDLKHQVRLMDSLTTACLDKSQTVVMVTHDLNLAAMFAHDVILMNNGRIVAKGAPPDVFVPEILSDVYGHPVVVTKNGPTGRLFIFPETDPEEVAARTGP